VIALKTLLLSELKILTRDRMALFFTLLFPLVFILVFGFLMGDIGDVSRSAMGVFTPVEGDREHIDAAMDQAETMAIVRFDSLDTLKDAVLERTVDFGLVWDGDTLRFQYDGSRIQENYAFDQVARGIATDFNLRRQGAAAPILVETIDVGGRRRRVGSVSCFPGSSPSLSCRPVCSPSPATSPR